MHNPESGPRTGIGEAAEKSPEILDVEKLDRCLGAVASELKERNMPVDASGRADMDYFKDNKIYPEEQVERDKNLIREKEKEWKLEHVEAEGEEFEKLVIVILHKYLPKNLSIIRASRYDDIKRSVDNFIIEEETGNIICSLDEIESDNPIRVQEKIDSIGKINKRGGACIKYGIRHEPGKKELKLGEVKNIPLFFLAVTSLRFEQELKNLRDSLDETSSKEKNFFIYLKNLLGAQIDRIQKDSGNPLLKERAATFKKLLKGISGDVS